jgi:hypothetical protein
MMKLMSRVHKATMTTRPMTTMVAATHSSRLGQVTRFIYDTIARKKAWTLRSCRCRSSERDSAALDLGSGLPLPLPLLEALPGTVIRFTSFPFRQYILAGRTGLEPATNGFGDRYSTN